MSSLERKETKSKLWPVLTTPTSHEEVKVLIAKERKGLGQHTPGLALKPHVQDVKLV